MLSGPPKWGNINHAGEVNCLVVISNERPGTCMRELYAWRALCCASVGCGRQLQWQLWLKN